VRTIADALVDTESVEPPRSPPEAAVGDERAAAGRSASRKQLLVLAVYAVVIWSVGNGLLPLLPKYAAGLGADDFAIGIYLATSYAAIALGTASAGWLSDRLGHARIQMVLLTLAVSPLLIVTSLITAFWQVVILTAIIWWFGGVALTFASILAGLSAGPDERGTVLGILALTAPMGSILGGLGIGYLADALGFSGMWLILGLVWLICPAAGLFVVEVRPSPKASTVRRTDPTGLRTTAFAILLVCGVLGAFGSFIGGFGRSLVMRTDFSNEAITSTVAVSGLVTLPFPLLLGFLSDRFGRLRFLALCYASGIAGLLVYSAAGLLWQFWTASALVAFVAYVSTSLGSALVVDLVDRESLGRGLALFGATGWIGGILGFAGGGVLFTAIGYANGFLIGAGLLVVALLLLVPIARSIPANRTARMNGPGRAPRKG